jgi:hypothetical protein
LRASHPPAATVQTCSRASWPEPKKGYLWITLQAHLNIVAVAALLEVAAIIITENAQPDEGSIAKANQQGVILLSTPLSTYEINGKLWEMGIRNKQ